MKVLMFGWEFPPFSSGGLGTACFGLTRSLSKKNVNITFVLPYDSNSQADFVKLVSPNIRIKKIGSVLKPYISSDGYSRLLRNKQYKPNMYGSSLFEEVYRYSQAAINISQAEDFDIIHCHDWMTFKAGINVKNLKGKPLIVHVHSTEFDRTGGHGVNQIVYNTEREGMEKADAVIAVSNFTKQKIIDHYGISPDKVFVVHNAIDFKDQHTYEIKKEDKVVLFLGRITLQKGPDHFLYAARKVLDHDPDVKFIIVGSGDMEHHIIEKAAELGTSKNVLFAGFLQGVDVEKAYRMADLYVMPSVSEPFGITALESIQSGTPVLISKQSGVSEVIKHCLKADFWDINDVADKIIAVLNSKALHETLKEHGSLEISNFNWKVPAQKCIDIYNKLLK